MLFLTSFNCVADIIDNCTDEDVLDIEEDSGLTFGAYFQHDDVDDNDAAISPPSASSSTFIASTGLARDNEVVSDGESSSDDFKSSNTTLPVSVTQEYMQRAVAFWKSGKKGNLSFKTVKRNFKLLKQKRDLYVWNKYVENCGTRRQKLAKVNLICLDKFNNAYSDKLTIHDVNIQQWGVQAAMEVGLKNFKASASWVYAFKKKYGIVSRKVTHFTTTTKLRNEAAIINACEKFVADTRAVIEVVGTRNVYNMDQSGFNLEMTSGRSLAKKGTKDVVTVVQSVSNTTHSYTIMPTISADGHLHSPLFIVLKEQAGSFGPRVRQNLFHADNIVVVASSSGKVNKKHLQQWREEVFNKIIRDDNRSVLIVDSFSGHKGLSVDEGNGVEDTAVSILTIPPGGTRYCQPLDVFGFRVFKGFVRRFTNSVRLLGVSMNFGQRNTILKMQSLIHRQLCAPVFRSVFRYAWYRSGYTSDRPEHYEHPVKYCFDAGELLCSLCQSARFLTCSWCQSSLCFEHFYTAIHNCSGNE